MSEFKTPRILSFLLIGLGLGFFLSVVGFTKESFYIKDEGYLVVSLAFILLAWLCMIMDREW